jgi:hypothetical protein
VDPEVYFNHAYSGYYDLLCDLLPNGPQAYSLAVGADRLFVFSYQMSTLKEYTFDGDLIRQREHFFGSHATYEAVLDPEGKLWYLDPAFDQVGAYDVETGEEVFTLGTFDAEPLSTPESLYLDNSQLFVADMGNCRVCRIDTISYEVELDWLCLPQPYPLWEYVRAGENEYIVANVSQEERELLFRLYQLRR